MYSGAYKFISTKKLGLVAFLEIEEQQQREEPNERLISAINEIIQLVNQAIKEEKVKLKYKEELNQKLQSILESYSLV